MYAMFQLVALQYVSCFSSELLVSSSEQLRCVPCVENDFDLAFYKKFSRTKCCLTFT